MKNFSYLLAATSAAVFIPSTAFASPIEKRVTHTPVNAEPVCFMQIDSNHVVDLTAMCSTSGSGNSRSTPSTPEEAKIQADLTKVQLETLARNRQSNAGLINRAMQAGMNLSR